MSAKFRAGVIVFLTWFVILGVTTVMNGRSFVPPKMDATSYLFLQTFIALLLGLCAYVIAAIVIAMRGLQK